MDGDSCDGDYEYEYVKAIRAVLIWHICSA